MNPTMPGSSACNDDRLVDAAWQQFDRTRPSGGDRSSVAQPARHGAGLLDSLTGYRILGEIHRGGQGVVYQAIQESTRRKVAIKVLREGPLADATERARFDLEVDILSRLKHPHIVTIHDRGQISGFSYLVMDYVAGLALDDYLTQAPDTSIDDRLRLFEKICEAVNAAHLRGVIHRDLKPGNIRIDENGEPRVLDFGLAKIGLPGSSGGNGVDATCLAPDKLTHSGQFVGSLPWASPEQAAGRGDQVDLRTDVYGLGVILYQMLTGRFPYPVVGSITQILQHISQTPPARPRTIKPAITEDVQTIVLKCLAKEPERRYQNAGDVARDIRRYLAGEPIDARRDSGWYVLRKTLARHQTATVLGSILLVLITASAVGMFVLYRSAEGARQTAVREHQTAKRQAIRAATVQGFLEQMLGALDPNVAAGGDTTLLENLADEAAKRIDGELGAQPEARQSIHTTLGVIYKKIGRYDAAQTQLQAALQLAETLNEVDNLAVAAAAVELGDVRRLRGELTQAETLANGALQRYRAAKTDSRLFAAALQLMGEIRTAQARYDEALAFFHEALAMYKRQFCEPNEYIARSLADIGSVLDDAGRFREAEEHLRRALAMHREVFGEEHLRIAETAHLLGITLGKTGRLDEAGEQFERTLRVQRKLLAADDPEIGITLCTLGTLHMNQGRFAAGEAAYRESLEILEKRLGPEHPATVRVVGELGEAARRQGRLPEARALLEDALERLQQASGASSPDVARILMRLAALNIEESAFAVAEAQLQRAIEIRRDALGLDHPDVKQALAALADLYEQSGRSDEAAAVRAQIAVPDVGGNR